MDYLYDEISEDDRNLVLAHLARCQSCQQEIDALKNTSGILQKWGDIDPDFNVIMVTEKVSWSRQLKNYIENVLPQPKRIALGFVYAAVGFLLVLSLANTRVSYREGEFNVSMGLFSKPAPETSPPDVFTKQVLEKLQQDNYYLMNTLLQQSEARQRKEIAATIMQMRQDFERQRVEDLNLVGYGLNNIEQNTNRQIQQTGRSLNELIQLINAQRK